MIRTMIEDILALIATLASVATIALSLYLAIAPF